LDDSYYDLKDDNISYRIYGSTLWSENHLTDGLNDFNMIKMKNEKNWTVPINISYYNELHTNSVTKLFEMIKTHKFDYMAPKDLIIVTHFPPVRKTNRQENYTSHPMYQNQTESINKYFYDNLVEIEDICTINSVLVYVYGMVLIYIVYYIYIIIYHICSILYMIPRITSCCKI